MPAVCCINISSLYNTQRFCLRPKKHLSFSALRKALSMQFEQIDDCRQAAKVEHVMHDCLMSAFAMMFFQDSSLLAFQQRMQDHIQYNNLTSTFNIKTIPKDTQLRTVIDNIPPMLLEGAFSDFLHRLQRGKLLESYRLIQDMYLVPIDGSQYFSSGKINCPHCLSAGKKKKRYYHQILQAAIVHPDMRQVLPLAPEQISNRDGTRKQDCEINAAKRLIPKIRKAHPKLKLIVTADGLYSKQPFIDALKEAGMSFILVAKPDDHKLLFEWVNELTQLDAGGSMEITDAKGRRHCYQWVNDVPLNGSKDADQVNFFQYQIVSKEHKITYRNSWVTDLAVDKKSVITLVKGGRARWKIENETFNTLKNQGYHIEHNFGHGRQSLSMNFLILNLLAFYVHQILDLSDKLYQKVRYEKFTSRLEFWNQLRCTFRILLFKSWEHMLSFIYDPPMKRAP